MSMNLTLHVGGEKEDLYQTPTIITYSCLYKNGYMWFKPGFDKSALKQDTASNILEKYCMWLIKQQERNVFKTAAEFKEYKEDQQTVWKHIDHLRNMPPRKMKWSYI